MLYETCNKGNIHLFMKEAFMKKFKRTAAFIMALAMVISTVISVPTQAASKNYWWAYGKCEYYNYVDGKWEKESTDTNS